MSVPFKTASLHKIHSGKFGAAFIVRVTWGIEPRPCVQSLAYGLLHVYLSPPPDERDLNDHLIRCLSRVLGLAPEQIEIVDETPISKGKVVVFYDISSEALEERVRQFLGLT